MGVVSLRLLPENLHPTLSRPTSSPRAQDDRVFAGSPATTPKNLPPVYYHRVGRDMTSSLLMPPPPPPPVTDIPGNVRGRESPDSSMLKRQRSCSPKGLYPLMAALSPLAVGLWGWPDHITSCVWRLFAEMAPIYRHEWIDYSVQASFLPLLLIIFYFPSWLKNTCFIIS